MAAEPRTLGSSAATGWGLVAVLASIVLVSLPAWTGSWVYDDWLMLSNPAMDGADDMLQVFTRTSADYLRGLPSAAVGGVTYRPLSMLSLIAVQGIWPDAPLLHHAVSLALHLSCVVLLWRSASALCEGPAALAIAGSFGLHPLGIEAYGWINGRSDVLACCGLGLLAVAMLRPLSAPVCNAALAAFGAALAALSKETGFVAVPFVALGALMPARGAWKPATAKAHRGALLAAAGALLACLALRTTLVGQSAPVPPTVGFFAELGALLHLYGLALCSLLVPLPRTMITLAHALAQPLTATSVFLLALLLAAVALLVRARRYRALVWLAGAAACLVPCLVVRHAFWLGFDRYLYMPLFLAALALAATALPARLLALARTWRLTGAALALLSLAYGSFGTAATYASQAAHMRAMLVMRPDDPTGYLVGAKWLWNAQQRDGAKQLIDRVPRRALAPPVASQLATLLAKMGRSEEAFAVVADMERSAPNDPYVLLDVLSVRLHQVELAAAFAIASKLSQKPAFCRAARAQMGERLETPTWSEGARQRTRSFLASYTCAR